MNTHNAATKNTAIKKSSANLGDYAALIGIDWADQKHALATLALPLQNQAQPELSTLEHKTDALIEWISSVQERFGGGRIAIAPRRFATAKIVRARARLKCAGGWDAPRSASAGSVCAFVLQSLSR
jgi:hypothetical protein